MVEYTLGKKERLNRCTKQVLADINGTAVVGKLLVRGVVVYLGDIAVYHAGRTDTDRTGTEYDNLFLIAVLTLDELLCLVFVVIGRVEVRCLCLELACASINHLINGMAVHRAFLTGNTLNGCIQIAEIGRAHV